MITFRRIGGKQKKALFMVECRLGIRQWRCDEKSTSEKKAIWITTADIPCLSKMGNKWGKEAFLSRGIFFRIYVLWEVILHTCETRVSQIKLRKAIFAPSLFPGKLNPLFLRLRIPNCSITRKKREGNLFRCHMWELAAGAKQKSFLQNWRTMTGTARTAEATTQQQ